MLLETIADTKMPLTHNIPTSSLTASSQASRTGKTDTVTKANEFAATWIDAWNSHDLDRILVACNSCLWTAITFVSARIALTAC